MNGSLFNTPAWPRNAVKLDLEKICLGRRTSLPVGVKNLEVTVDYALLEMTLDLSAYVLGQKLTARQRTCQVRFEYRSPASWRDHFKLTFGGRWWLRAVVRRWPVKYDRLAVVRDVTLTIEDLLAVYPEATIESRGLGPVSFADIRLSPRSLTLTEASCSGAHGR